MPQTLGRMIPPALSTAPSSPSPGEMYYDTDDQNVYQWDPTAGIWVDLSSLAGVAVGDGLQDTGGTIAVNSTVARKNINNSFSTNQTIAGNLTLGTTVLSEPLAGRLSTAQFRATDGLITLVKAGIIADADFSTTPITGTIAVDTSNNRLYVRVGGTWRYATLT